MQPEINYAHPEDSLAPAEHISPEEFERQLDELKDATNPYKLLLRAQLYHEYALSTPSTEDDDRVFKLAQADLLNIQDRGLHERSKTLLSAKRLLSYEPTTRARAARQEITPAMKIQLQDELSGHMLAFFDGEELSANDCGQLSEFIVPPYMLLGNHFPHLALEREEGNIIANDNHDYYTLHPCQKNRVKKAPLSVKYREHVVNDLVVTLTVGAIALEVSRTTPPYNVGLEKAFTGRAKRPTRPAETLAATRRAADIMICMTLGETLSVEDRAFMWGMANRLEQPVIEFADLPRTVDYDKNAAAISAEITRRKLISLRKNSLEQH